MEALRCIKIEDDAGFWQGFCKAASLEFLSHVRMHSALGFI